MPPIIQFVMHAKNEFFKHYGFPAERLHVSLSMEGLLYRAALANNLLPHSIEGRMNGAEIFGLEIRRMTKNTPHIEFFTVAERNGMIYSQHARIEPETIGLRTKINENGIMFETKPEDYEDGQS